MAGVNAFVNASLGTVSCLAMQQPCREKHFLTFACHAMGRIPSASRGLQIPSPTLVASLRFRRRRLEGWRVCVRLMFGLRVL
jgi:hypothetical protein